MNTSAAEMLNKAKENNKPEDEELPETTDTTEEESEEESETTDPDARETVVISPAVIPTKEEMEAICKDIKVNFDANVDVKPVVFRFKTTKDKDTGIETKRDPLELPIPYPNVKGVVAILEEGGKQLELLMEAVENVVTQTARSMITDNQDLNATNLPVEKLSWDAIANMPKPERTGGGIAKEVWEDFAKDYIAVMPEATGKSKEQVTRAAKLLENKFAAVKTNIPVLELLTSQLAIYVENSKRADEFTGCVEFLIDKADKLINTKPEELLNNL